MLHIKLKGMKRTTTCKPIMFLLHPQSLGWDQNGLCKLKGMIGTTTCKLKMTLHTLDPSGGVKRSKHFKVIMLHITLKKMKHRTKCKQDF